MSTAQIRTSAYRIVFSYDIDRSAPCLRRDAIQGSRVETGRESWIVLSCCYSLISGEDAMPTGLLMLVIVENGEV